MLVILDGWGIREETEGNAVLSAATPFLDGLAATYPSTRLNCMGKAVGLPGNIMGNSEVGHLNIGAGRIVYQDLLRIDRAIEDRSFMENSALNGVMSAVKSGETSLHLMGLVSDGGVHSQLSHLLTLLKMARSNGLSKVFVHAILDGRDTPPQSGAQYLDTLQNYIKDNDFGKIATVCGRYYAMDRDKRWERVQKAYALFTRGTGVKAKDAVAAVREAYAAGETDEFVSPIVMTGNTGRPVGSVRNGDGVIFFNFRADRAREITRAFTEDAFSGFDRGPMPELCHYVCMTEYDATIPAEVAFKPNRSMPNIAGELFSQLGLTQFRCAETEKYAHVTFFFNGGREKPFEGEDRQIIPSPKVKTYDMQPEMSAEQVCDEVLKRLDSGKYDVVICNFANPDMVGHTGVLDAAVTACKTVDACVGKVVNKVKELGGSCVVMADHGNFERMWDLKNDMPHTAHTVGDVPLIVIDEEFKDRKMAQGGKLADVVPTMLEVMGLEKPKEMTGKSLLR